MAMTAAADVKALYRTLLTKWNEKDAAGFGDLFTDDGSIVGFDGSCVESSASITEHLQSIFSDHHPASYIAKVREVRDLGPGSMLLHSVVGMVPPGGSDINPSLNAVQTLVAVRRDGAWRIASFQNTPAAFHGRPEEVETLTRERIGLLMAGQTDEAA